MTRAVAAVLWLLASAGTAAPTRFFKVVVEDEKYWLAAPPDGRRFYSMGVDVIIPGDWSPKPGSTVYRGGEVRGGEPAWARFEAGRMRDWGFNTVGAWSARSMERQGIPYTACLHLAAGKDHRLIDVWSDDYARRVREAAAKQMGDRRADDPDLIGWYLDNELPWYGQAGWRTGDARTLLDLYRELPAGAPGRAKAEAATNPDEFAGQVASRFCELAVAAVRARDPHHLILGVRFAGDAPAPVVRAVGAASDVCSVNWYVKHGRPDPGHLDRIYLAAKKPILITEFSYRAVENRSDNRNSSGADVTVTTQVERARRYRRYVETLVALPQVVGFHWFQWFDQPSLGRFDGENCNYGLVDHADEPYEELLAAMRDLNARAGYLHGRSAWEVPVNAGMVRPRPLQPVAGLDARPELAPPRFAALTYADFARDSATGMVWGDAASRCDGRLGRRGGAAVFTCSSGPGWGCGVNLAPPRGGPVNAAGAHALVLVARITAGVRFVPVLTEDGAGPASATSFAGAGGADGEQYHAPELTGTGGRRTYTVPLGGCALAEGFGNPSGNGVLDVQALGRVELYVPGSQGAATLEISSIRFE